MIKRFTAQETRETMSQTFTDTNLLEIDRTVRALCPFEIQERVDAGELSTGAERLAFSEGFAAAHEIWIHFLQEATQ